MQYSNAHSGSGSCFISYFIMTQLSYSIDIKGYRLDVFYVEGFHCICSCNDPLKHKLITHNQRTETGNYNVYVYIVASPWTILTKPLHVPFCNINSCYRVSKTVENCSVSASLLSRINDSM